MRKCHAKIKKRNKPTIISGQISCKDEKEKQKREANLKANLGNVCANVDKKEKQTYNNIWTSVMQR